MNFISRWFSKSPSDFLTKGDKHMEAGSFFAARTCYEDGLLLCPADDSDSGLRTVFPVRIEAANLKLAELNIHEAEGAFSRGEAVKAIDHLELVKTLTRDETLLEKAESLITEYSRPVEERAGATVASSCSTCVSSAGSECAESASLDASLPLIEYYELLIQQLPPDQYVRYAALGEDFACAYIAASRDEHLEALDGFEKCIDTVPRDIYWCEKGKVQHRLGNDSDAEQHLRMAVQSNSSNSLAWFTLAHLLRENDRFGDALTAVDTMLEEDILPEQALLLRADIFDAVGDHDAAVDQYVELLQTPYARVAADKLYGILLQIGRQDDAAVIFKKYLNKSCH